MLPRFFVPDLDTAASRWQLPADEAHHLTRVLRLGPGDDVVVFDGRGAEFRARVLSGSRDSVHVECVERLVPVPEAHIALTLVQAVLKGDRMDDVVRDATMMGVAAIVPIATARTIAKRQTVERWERVAVSSAKQCRRAVVPRITPTRPLAEWLASERPGLTLALVEPTAGTGDEMPMRSLLDRAAPSAVSIVVGPEGGWTSDERTALVAAGCLPATLGALTLRADAVPLAAIALVRFAFGDL